MTRRRSCGRSRSQTAPAVAPALRPQRAVQLTTKGFDQKHATVAARAAGRTAASVKAVASTAGRTAASVVAAAACRHAPGFLWLQGLSSDAGGHASLTCTPFLFFSNAVWTRARTELAKPVERPCLCCNTRTRACMGAKHCGTGLNGVTLRCRRRAGAAGPRPHGPANHGLCCE